jgi:hypothetical protein
LDAYDGMGGKRQNKWTEATKCSVPQPSVFSAASNLLPVYIHRQKVNSEERMHHILLLVSEKM